MKFGKILLAALVAYVGLVVAFESMIGLLQPQSGETLVITTTDSEGASSDRVLARLSSDDRIYVAANHWPRAWYQEALANPAVEVTIEGERRAYRAVPASDEESARLHLDHPAAFGFRFITGFPPRAFMRLDPVAPAGPPGRGGPGGGR